MQSITISQWLKQTADALQIMTEAAYEEADYILLHALQKDRVYLISHANDIIATESLLAANQLLQQRLTQKPLAYVLNHTHFYGLDLFINDHVLVPRNDTECLVEWILNRLPNQALNIVDLGTGSGAIACALKYNRPTWHVTATDISAVALTVAKQNANTLDLDITFVNSHWFSNINNTKFDIIVSNPPYIAKDDPNVMNSVDTYEPDIALYAEDNGLADFKHILLHAKQYLNPNGLIVLEHGFKQKHDLQQLAQQLHYKNIETYQDLNGLDRFTVIQT